MDDELYISAGLRKKIRDLSQRERLEIPLDAVELAKQLDAAEKPHGPVGPSAVLENKTGIDTEVLLDRIGIDEEVRCLNKKELGVLLK